MSTLIVVGSLGLDTLETPFDRAERVLGGSAAYFALAAKLYTDVGIVAVVGDDFPQAHVDLLDRKGVDLAGLQRVTGETFFWSGRYHYDLNTRDTLETRLGVFADFRPTLPEGYRAAPYVFLANILPTLQMAVQEQVRDPRLVVLDSMNLWIETQKAELTEAMRRCHVVTINEEEARQYAGTYSLRAAATRIMEHGPRAVIVKRGEYGAALFTNETYFAIPAYPLESVFDPTGAGDTFAGGLMGYLASQDDADEATMRRAMIYGSVMASFNVEEFGTDRVARLTHEEINERFRAFKRMTHFEEIPFERAVRATP